MVEAIMTDELARRVAERFGLTPDEAREQAILFAYANANMENPAITLDMIRKAAEAARDSQV